ncbi:MAG: hybrid sensor histidine kinase/response regulator [Gammaproteobacteria bacterium]|jgi:signal transduction histidine kinase/ActR/RegA family two-component response regulator|nr:hybrid sensor histidine kinase/response regulator [Gammaproteobacteria bacterium]
MLANQSAINLKSEPVLAPLEDEYLYHEQIKLAYEQLHVASLASISGYLILPALLWNQIPHFNIILWLTLCITFLLIAPHILLRQYRRSDEQTRKKACWSKWLVGVAFVGSCSWGSLGILLYPPDSLVYQFVIMFFISVGAAVATIIGASYQPVFWAKFLPNILPFCIFVLFKNDAMHTLMGLGIPFFYGTALLVLYRNLHKHLLESLRLRLEKNHLIEQLQQKKQAAEKANAEKSRFLAAASHDLRQPLHAQMLLTDELKSHAHNEQCAQIVHKLETSMKAMNGLFNELLDISKLDACAITPNISEFSVSDILQDLELDYSPLAKNSHLRFRIRPSELKIRSDQNLLSRILRNLVSNAIRYTDKGGILIGCRRRGNTVLIQIWDTGNGIPAHEQEHIFSEFYQLHNPERDRNKGLGLGLAIVARLAELLNHKIHIESHISKGSVFSVEVPMATGSYQGSSTKLPAVIQNIDITGLNVLLVEDDELILTTMRDLLGKWGCNVFAASSFDTAMSHLGSLINRLDLIIADYRLRNNTTGIQVIDKLESALNRKIPAIVVTGDTSPQILQTILQRGRYVLHKPVAPQKLRQFVNEVLSCESSKTKVDNTPSLTDS